MFDKGKQNVFDYTGIKISVVNTKTYSYASSTNNLHLKLKVSSHDANYIF